MSSWHAAARGNAVTTLADANAAERAADKLRRAGSPDAAAAYDAAGDLYADLDERTRGSRCRRKAQNLRHPKVIRGTASTARPPCLACKKPLPRYGIDGRTFANGTPREWGRYGDNRFCGHTCGWVWACLNSKVPTWSRRIK